MRKFKQAVVLALAMCMSIPATVPIFAAQEEQGRAVAIDGSQPLTQEELAQLYSNSKNEDGLGFEFPGRGFAYDANPAEGIDGSKKSLEDMAADILNRTNLKISTVAGTLTLENEAVWIEEQKLVATEKTTLPENKIKAASYTKKWSGIRNFYFPNTYYSAGNFSTSADNAHHIKIYAMDGAYAATIHSVLQNGKYITKTAIEGGEYYVVIFNDSDSKVTNASFTAE